MLNNQEIKMPLLIEDLGMFYATEKSKRKTRYGLYKCNCGIEFKSDQQSVKAFKTKSCGCYSHNILMIRNTKHGMADHPVYAVWKSMIQRSTNKNDKNYMSYGGRGIKVCERWLESFENFRDDMLHTWKQGLSIDRINNDGNYEPLNCRWVARNIQSRNTKKIRSNNNSGYRGVCFNKQTNNWTCNIGVNCKNQHLGLFTTAIEAAQAYDNYVTLHNLEHTKNFS